MSAPVRCPKCNAAITGVMDWPEPEMPACPIGYPLGLCNNLLRVTPCGHEFSHAWVALALSESARRLAGCESQRLPSPYDRAAVAQYEVFLTRLYQQEIDQTGNEATIKVWQEYAVRCIFAYSPPGSTFIDVASHRIVEPWEIEAGGPEFRQRLLDTTRATVTQACNVPGQLHDCYSTAYTPRPFYSDYRDKLVKEIALILSETDTSLLLKVARWVVRGRTVSETRPAELAKTCALATSLIAKSDWDFPLRERLADRMRSGLLERLGDDAVPYSFERITVDDRDFLIAFLEFVLTQKIPSKESPRPQLDRRSRRRIIRQEAVCDATVAANEMHRP